MKLKEIEPQLFEELEKELKGLKKNHIVDTIIDLGGHCALVYECLECMYHRGRFVMPITYKWRRELTHWYMEYIREESKKWRK